MHYSLHRLFVVGSLLVLGGLLATPANAQSFKVLKVKGNKAIIQFSRGETLEKGESYSVSGEGPSESGSSGGARGKTVSFSSDLFTGSTSSGNGASSSRTSFDVAGRYGWNDGMMEYGPIASIAYLSIGGASTRAIGVGGFFDYNLVENKPGVDLVYGAGAQAAIGQSSDSGGESGSLFTLDGGGQLKWFPFGHDTAIRLDAGLRYQRTSVSNITTTTTGLAIAAGLQTYF